MVWVVDARQPVIIVVVGDGLAFLGKVGCLLGQYTFLPFRAYSIDNQLITDLPYVFIICFVGILFIIRHPLYGDSFAIKISAFFCLSVIEPSYSFTWTIAMFHFNHRILLKNHRNVFSPHSECAVGSV